MRFSSRKYVDMIYKVSGKYGNWNPPRKVEVGDWGEIDKDTGDFVREGNIFHDTECTAALSELSGEELVKNGRPEDEVRIIAGDTVKIKTNLYTDVGGTGELGIRVQGEWEFTPRNRAALLTVIDPYSYYLEVGIAFPKLRQLRKLKGKAIVTEALNCPAYALLLTEKGKGGKASLSMYTGLSEAGVGMGAGTGAGWRHTSDSGVWRTACEYRTGDEKDAVYTPLYKLQKIATGWRPRYRGAPASGAVLEEPVDEDYSPPWEELDEDGEEVLDDELASPDF